MRFCTADDFAGKIQTQRMKERNNLQKYNDFLFFPNTKITDKQYKMKKTVRSLVQPFVG